MPRRSQSLAFRPDSAIGYLRVSTEEQAAGGVSLDAVATAAAEDGFRLYIPPRRRCTDNAAMIAAAGATALARGLRALLDLAVDPGLRL